MKFSISVVIAASAALAVEGARHLHDTERHDPRTYYHQAPETLMRTNHHQPTKNKTLKDTKSMNHKRSSNIALKNIEKGSKDCALLSLVVDESGSMMYEHDFLANSAVPMLVANFKAKRYNHIFICSHGFGSAKDSRTNGFAFHGCTDASAWSETPTPGEKGSIMGSWRVLGGVEDSYLGIMMAIENTPGVIDGYQLNSTCKTMFKEMILLTDEDRDVFKNNSITKADVASSLASAGYVFNAIVNIDMSSPPDKEDFEALGFFPSDDQPGKYEFFVPDGSNNGNYTTLYKDEYLKYLDAGLEAGNSVDDYTSLALDTLGSVYDLGMLRLQNADYTDVFVNSLSDTQVREIMKKNTESKQPSEQPQWQGVEEQLHKNIQAIVDGCKARGVSVAFYDDAIMNEPILRGYGKVSADEDAPGVTADTVFMIASVSKVFAGTSVMKLIEDGVISSEQEDICKVLPDEYGITSCRHTNFRDTPVTWAHIMSHTSSMITEVPTTDDGELAYGPAGGYDGFALGNDSCPLEDVVAFYRDVMTDTDPKGDGYTKIGTFKNDVDWHDLASKYVDSEFEDEGAQGSVWLKNHKPGTLDHYSNLATGYVAALAEHALNYEISYPDYCKEKIFSPLGMSNTAWFRRDLPDGVLEAVPTYWFDDHWEDVSLLDEKHYCFIDYASGQLHTSARDLSKFLGAHLVNYGADVLYDSVENGKKTLSKSNGDVSPHGFFWMVLTNEDKDDAEGWQELAKDLDWTNAGHHSGGEEGVVTDMYVFPESGVYMAVLSNTDGTCDVTEDIMFELMEYRKAVSVNAPPPTDPAPTAPAPTDPPPTDPVPTDPAPSGPLPTGPLPSSGCTNVVPSLVESFSFLLACFLISTGI